MDSSNLVIIFTDIVGFTESTASRSRIAIQTLITRHNDLLLPLVKGFGGTYVKSIGDALLLTFSSSTDALLCCMAMQDSLYVFNRGKPKSDQIHIRIAVNIGEVRTAYKDVLGDPVNVTSRIEKITPEDEIYFSEAVYMTMNKAEIPTEEVGYHEFKGVSEKVKLYRVPRFTTQKLTVDKINDQKTLGSVSLPYGGVHLRVPNIKKPKNYTKLALGLFLLGMIIINFLLWNNSSKKKIPLQIKNKLKSAFAARRQKLRQESSSVTVFSSSSSNSSAMSRRRKRSRNLARRRLERQRSQEESRPPPPPEGHPPPHPPFGFDPNRPPPPPRN